ncbi:MAG: serine protease [Gemmataceae bacterium]
MRAILPALALCLLVPQLNAGGIPAKTLKEIKAASVYIKCELSGPAKKTVPVTGSGFVVRVDKTTVFIATNSHVVTPLPDEVMIGKPKVVFNSGTPFEVTVNADVVARDRIRDLAILKVTGLKDIPRPIPLDPSIEVGETMPVFAVGYPFGADLALGKTNPSVTITKGVVSALRYDSLGQVNFVQIDAEINPGNSGGPVVDDKGNLIGVAVSKLVKTRTVGFAIPLKALDDMLQGRVATVLFDTMRVAKGDAEVNVEAGLIDPLDKVKKVTIRFRPAGELKDLPRPDKDGNIPVLKDSRESELKIEKGKGVGALTIKPAKSLLAGKMLIAYQTSVVNGTGKTVLSPAGVAIVDFTQVVHADKLPKKGASKVFTHKMRPGKHYVVEMRADPKDMDPRLKIEDAEGKTVAEDDGAGGLFDALIVLNPATEGEYKITASALKGMGPFTVRIREDTGRELGPRGLTLNETLFATDAPDPVMMSPSVTFNVILKKGKAYAIDMKSKEFDPYLRIENMANISLKNEDVGGGGHSTLLFTPFQDGIYRVCATSFDRKAGRFELQVRETPKAAPRDVGADGLKIADKLTALDALDVINGKATKFRCKVFEVNLKAGKKYQLDMSSIQFDSFLRIEDQRGRELAFDDDSGGMLNARLVFEPKTDGVYRVIASQFDARVGAFELTVRKLR